MFTGYLLEAGYHPVIIPDTDNAFGIDSSFEGATILEIVRGTSGYEPPLRVYFP